jgi:hypothetical protein
MKYDAHVSESNVLAVRSLYGLGLPSFRGCLRFSLLHGQDEGSRRCCKVVVKQGHRKDTFAHHIHLSRVLLLLLRCLNLN